MHHPLGAAIKLGWNSLRQRSYLRDAHLTFSLFTIMNPSPCSAAPACRTCNAAAYAKFRLPRLLLGNVCVAVVMMPSLSRTLRASLQLSQKLRCCRFVERGML